MNGYAICISNMTFLTNINKDCEGLKQLRNSGVYHLCKEVIPAKRLDLTVVKDAVAIYCKQSDRLLVLNAIDNKTFPI